ncbi:hypothetical protein MYCTH_2303448, partial [Thermothelomyces thermophilus ATCC 42464]
MLGWGSGKPGLSSPFSLSNPPLPFPLTNQGQGSRPLSNALLVAVAIAWKVPFVSFLTRATCVYFLGSTTVLVDLQHPIFLLLQLQSLPGIASGPCAAIEWGSDQPAHGWQHCLLYIICNAYGRAKGAHQTKNVSCLALQRRHAKASADSKEGVSIL